MQLQANTTLKIFTLSVIASLILIGCDGGSGTDTYDGESTNNTEEVKQLTLTFPISSFDIVELSTSSYAPFEINTSLMNGQTYSKETYYSQETGTIKESGLGEDEYLLTKDKLYYTEGGEHPNYVISNTYPSITIAYDSNGTGLSLKNIYQTIKLVNKPVTTDAVTNNVFNIMPSEDEDYSKDDAYKEIKSNFLKQTATFDDDAMCYQLMTSQKNQPYFEFDRTDNISNTTLTEWVQEQQQDSNVTVVQEQWAGYKVAYALKGNNSLNAETEAVVEMNGTLYSADYEAAELINFTENYTEAGLKTEFDNGICSYYNESAANTLRTALHNAFK